MMGAVGNRGGMPVSRAESQGDAKPTTIAGYGFRKNPASRIGINMGRNILPRTQCVKKNGHDNRKRDEHSDQGNVSNGSHWIELREFELEFVGHFA